MIKNNTMLYLYIFFFLLSTPLLAENKLEDFTADVEKVYSYYGEENYAEAVKLFSRLYYIVANKDIKQNLAIHNALSYRRLDDIVKSDQWFKISFKLSKDINDEASKILIISQLAENRKIMKDYDNAILLYEEVLSYDFLTTDDLLVVKYKLGLSYFYQNNYDEALFYFKDSFDLSNELNLYYIQASSSLLMGYIYQCMGNYDESMLHYRRSYDISIVKGHYDLAIDSLLGLGYLFERVSLYRSAIADYSEALLLILNHKEYAKLDELIRRLEYLIFINPTSVDSSWVTFLDIIKSSSVKDNDVKLKLEIVTAYGKYYSKEYTEAYSIAKELYDSTDKGVGEYNQISLLILLSEISRLEKKYDEALFYAGNTITLLDNIKEESDISKKENIDFRSISISNRDIVYAIYSHIYLSQEMYVESKIYIDKALLPSDNFVLKDRYSIVEKSLIDKVNTDKKFRDELAEILLDSKVKKMIDKNAVDKKDDSIENISSVFDTDKLIKDSVTTAEMLDIVVRNKLNEIVK